MDNEVRQVPAERETQGLPHTIAIVIFTLITLTVFIYLCAVVTGKIGQTDRLGTPEAALALVACLSLILVIHPAALDRLRAVPY